MTSPVPAPAPLTTPEYDVRDLDGFMLNTERLLASELWALANGETFKAAVGLWCRAWKQIPAGSLPNDERVLASFAGVTPSRWAKIKTLAMRGFIVCSDGRLYHRTLCQDVIKAYAKKLERQDQHMAESDRKRREREDRARMFADLRAVGKVPAWNVSTGELRQMMSALSTTGHAPVTRDESVTVTASPGQGQDRDRTGTPSSPTAARAIPATTATLAKRISGVDSHRVRDAVSRGDVLDLVTAFNGNRRGDRDSEWRRDTDSLELGVATAIFAWKRFMREPIREPSGFRKARAEWRTLAKSDRDEHIQRLMEFGLPVPKPSNGDAA